MNTNSRLERDAFECIDRMRLGTSSQNFGFRVQALAAHVLLRLGYRVEAVNQSGHPDIIAIRNGREFRFEVEAEVGNPRPRKLTDSDFASLLEVPDGFGYYALAISFPTPYWILVPASKLYDRRHPSTNILLEALSDKTYSADWTTEYLGLLNDACHQISRASFDFNRLSTMALEGRGL